MREAVVVVERGRGGGNPESDLTALKVGGVSPQRR